MSIADLLDEPFLALPETAGPLRDYWLALDQRGGHPVRIQAEINDTEETYEAVASGIGICLLGADNAPIFDRGDVTMLPVTDLSPSELVLAWHPDAARDPRRPLRTGTQVATRENAPREPHADGACKAWDAGDLSPSLG